MEKRKPRSYKIADKPYNKAKRRAKGELATLIEHLVTEFGNGAGYYICREPNSITYYYPPINHKIPPNTKLKSSNKK
jgi:hypothetical protein